MRIVIHRGHDQIGGAITEITTAKTKILIDFGEELSPHQRIDTEAILKDCDAIFFTHYHGDHIGLYKSIPLDIPTYLGGIAKRIFGALIARTDPGNRILAERFLELEPLQRITIGDIEIIPLLIDHSAFDAYLFIIKADGKSVLHTGDFRGHGYRSKGLLPTLKKYVGKVDVLITEGTCLSRTETELLSEKEVQSIASAMMREKKYVFALCSSTNIERIAALYHANPVGRYFLCDGYQKDILAIVTETAARKSSLYDFGRAVVYGDNLRSRFRERGFCMLIRARADHRDVINLFPPDQRLVLYSMWTGYLAGEHQNERITGFLSGLNYTCLHSSGHADAATIRAVIEAIKPGAILPIHTENADWFSANYPEKTVRLLECQV